MVERKATLLLSANDVARLLELPNCIAAVERGFLALGENRLPPPQIMALHAGHGGFHIKAAVWTGEKKYFVAKANANFPQNPKIHGLPTIQGVIIVCDAGSGELLALMDSIEITARRTAAATAVAAKSLARPESSVLAVCGCGKQGLMHLRGLLCVLPIQTVYAFDTDEAARKRFVEEVSSDFKVDVSAVHDVRQAVRNSDVVATCTTSRQYFIMADDIRPGTFIAAVGADSENKHEIDPHLFPMSKVVVDSLAQCSTIGDLHHAILAGTATRESVHGELADVVAGHKPGRTSRSEITLFDSTGVATADAAAAACVYEKAIQMSPNNIFRF